MATLVLTAVGTAIGGPIGAMVGGLLGSALDARLFPARGREGPRLQDLRVQTSTYGSRVPRIYGAMRVAGSVIWSTDLKERRERSGGGKGRPSVTTYAYSASFAVAVSSRRIGSIGRIWADGGLLRGAAGDFKAGLGAMRVHDGAAGQRADPLIAADVGVDRAPGFRDLAYVVFENLDLADFGNRIPTLTFEVLADPAPVEMRAVAGDLLEEVLAPEVIEMPLLTGYAVDGMDVRAGLAPLVESFDLCTRTAGEHVLLTGGSTVPVTFDPAEQVLAANGERLEAPTARRGAIESVPRRLAQRHYDPARDYQVGVQSAEREGPGRRALQVDLPATLDAGVARQITDRRLRRMVRRRNALSLNCGWAALTHEIGDVVRCVGRPGAWRIEAIEWEAMVCRLKLVAQEGGALIPDDRGDGGAVIGDPDHAVGPTALALIELPMLEEGLATTPLVYAAATGVDAGWRRAALLQVTGPAGDAVPAGGTAPRAVIGTATSILSAASGRLVDEAHAVLVSLVSPDDILSDADDAALRAGANLCVIGDELLQFGRAEALAPGVFRLSRLLRGLRGTEWAAASHGAGEAFVLVEAERLARIAVPATDRGRTMDVRAIGIGDTVPAAASHLVSGVAILPPSPVHGRVARTVDGGLLIGWTRRSRLGWAWLDGVETPLGEERERYRVTVSADGAVLRTVEIDAPLWTYPPVETARDAGIAAGRPMSLHIEQIGIFGASRPLVVPIDDFIP